MVPAYIVEKITFMLVYNYPTETVRNGAKATTAAKIINRHHHHDAGRMQ